MGMRPQYKGRLKKRLLLRTEILWAKIRVERRFGVFAINEKIMKSKATGRGLLFWGKLLLNQVRAHVRSKGLVSGKEMRGGRLGFALEKSDTLLALYLTRSRAGNQRERINKSRGHLLGKKGTEKGGKGGWELV